MADSSRNVILPTSYFKTVLLIDELEKWECLWSTSLKGHPDRVSRALAIENIASVLKIANFMACDITNRLKKLRESYDKELKKMQSSRNYRPKVFWFSHMDILFRLHPCRKITEFKTEMPQSLEDCQMPIKIAAIKSEKADEDNCHSDNSNHSEDSLTGSLILNIKVEEELLQNSTNEPPLKKTRIEEESVENIDGKETENGTSNTLDDKVNTCSATEQHKDDHYDAFGVYIASLLRTVSPEKALLLQPRIVNLIVSSQTEEP